MARKTVKKTQIISTIEIHDDIDEAAEALALSVIEFRYICGKFGINLDEIYKEFQVYYFTFGAVHFTRDGIAMEDFYVKVQAKDYSAARTLFVNHFTIPFMHAPDKFAFQYKYDKVDLRYFPKGEFASIVDTGQHILIDHLTLLNTTNNNG